MPAKMGGMSDVLMVTRPIVPPWDEGSKNTAWEVARNACRHRLHLMTVQRQGNLPDVGSVTWQPVYADEGSALEERLRLLLYLIRNDLEVDIYHFLFVPTLPTSTVLSPIVRMRRKRSVQTVPCLYRQGMASMVANRVFFADRVVALSDWTAARLRSLGVDGVVRVNAGIDLDRFRPPSGRRSLRDKWGLPQSKVLALFSGELSRLGSLEIILSVAPRVLRADSDLHLVIACPTRGPGDSVARRQAQEYVRRQGLTRCVTFMGDVIDFSALLAACDLLLFPVSTMTGKIDTPLTVLEAMATGLPVVLTDTPPLNEVLKAEAGIATPREDDGAFAQAVLQLTADEAQRQALGKIGRALVEEHYSKKKMVEAYEELYDEL